MARRPSASANPPEIHLTLQKAFDVCQITDNNPVTGAVVKEMASAETEVGQRLRELRKERDFSIRSLAGKSGLAINTLSMIENGKTSPSVSTLQILARVLDVPIAAFFEQETIEKKVVHVQNHQRPSVTVDTTRLEHLGKNLAGNAVQPFVVTLQPNSGSGQNLIIHTGHEFVYCLSGQVLYTIEDDSYLLRPGDSIVFESHLRHRWQNNSSEPAQVILVMIPSDTRDTPAERHFPIE
jgi:transcriptional regulator with XRE-family HTH domain